MNFLAHLHLSYPNNTEMVGNFIGDYVKGKKHLDYPSEICKGIKMHRQIDSFTDSHLLHKATRDIFREAYGLYSGVIADMVFDHYLALNWSDYCDISLLDFEQLCYDILDTHHDILPERVQYFIPKMKAASRLSSYAKREGIEESIHLMGQYTSLPQKTSEAMAILDHSHSVLENNFKVFYTDLQAHAQMPILL